VDCPLTKLRLLASMHHLFHGGPPLTTITVPLTVHERLTSPQSGELKHTRDSRLDSPKQNFNCRHRCATFVCAEAHR